MQQKYNIYLSFYILYLKETKRFIKVWGQTLFGPIITTSLFLIIFSTAMDNNSSYIEFLIPGLIMMTMINNAFANPSSSIFMAKVNGYIIDIIMAPITPALIIWAYVFGAVTRSFILFIILLIYSSLFVNFSFHNIFIIIYFFFMASIVMALLGIIGGIVSSKWDQLANFTSIFITPFVFLSGTFYSITKLPSILLPIVKYNPIFFMIDGFRSGFTGVNEYNLQIEMVSLFILAIVLFLISWQLWRVGYKIRN